MFVAEMGSTNRTNLPGAEASWQTYACHLEELRHCPFRAEDNLCVFFLKSEVCNL